MNRAMHTMPSASSVMAWALALTLFGAAPATWAGVTVQLTDPSNGTVYAQAPANIVLWASTTASQGYTVSKVEFFHGSTLIGTFTGGTSPAFVEWNNVGSGSYSLTAKATAIKNNQPDQTATSSLVNITVNARPVVALTNPVAGTEYAFPPPTISVNATATDSDGTIVKVEFRGCGDNGGLIRTITAPPYTFDWILPSPYWQGNAFLIYGIRADATDDRGAIGGSSCTAVSVKPTVTLTSPANGTNYGAPATIALNATVSPPDGPIGKVKFYNSSTLIAEDLTAPYSLSWENVPVGSYTITAVVVDAQDIFEWSSSPVNVTVTAASVEPKLHFIHVDHLNTPRLVADAAGTTVWKWDQQEPFASNVADENPSGLGAFDFPLRLPGQYFDKETNLYYNYFRDYDPSIGRYVESDPIGLRGGISTYVYANNSALLFVDDDGLKPYIFRVIGGGGVSLPGITGQVFNLAVVDPIAGQTCNYTVSCIGAGASFKGTPTFSGGGMPVTWDDGQECSNCRKFEGHGMAGTIAFQIGPIGYTPVDWLEVPNGPRLDFSGWAGGGVNIGGGTYACHFLLR